VASPDGSTVLREKTSGRVEDAAILGEQVATRLLESGAGAMLEEAGE